MTRVIKARALTTKDHVGLIASHEGAATPRRLRGIRPGGSNSSTSLVFVYLVWDWPYETTCVGMDADITIHDEETS